MSLNIYENGQLNKVAGGTTADSTLDATSTNAIQNKPVAEAISAINSDLSEKNQLVGLPYLSKMVTSTEAYTVIESGFIFAYANVTSPDDNHTIQYTRNGDNSIQIVVNTIPTPYPVHKGDVITVRGTSSYGTVIYPCGCFSI